MSPTQGARSQGQLGPGLSALSRELLSPPLQTHHVPSSFRPFLACAALRSRVSMVQLALHAASCLLRPLAGQVRGRLWGVAVAPSLRLQCTCPRRAAATAPSPGPGFQARGLSCAPKAWPELGFGVHDARETREHAGCLPGLRCTPAPRFGTSSLVSHSPASPVNRCHRHLPYVETESSRRDCTAPGPCWWVAGPRLEPK